MALPAFVYLYDINGAEPMTIQLPAVTGTTFDAGDILEFNAGAVRKASPGSAAIAGVAVTGVTAAVANQLVEVQVSNGSVYRVKYTPGTKTSLTVADRTVAFDLAVGAKTIALDDTTGGMCVIVNYDNEAKTADVLLKSRTLNP